MHSTKTDKNHLLAPLEMQPHPRPQPTLAPPREGPPEWPTLAPRRRGPLRWLHIVTCLHLSKPFKTWRRPMTLEILTRTHHDAGARRLNAGTLESGETWWMGLGYARQVAGVPWPEMRWQAMENGIMRVTFERFLQRRFIRLFPI